MDDALKLQKLAAARNMLKNHQQKKQRKQDVTDVTNATGTEEGNHNEEKEIDLDEVNPLPQIKSYFVASSEVPGVPQTTATYFDNSSSDLFLSENNASQSNTMALLSQKSENMDSITYEDPEIRQNEIFELVQQNKNNIDLVNETTLLNKDISVTEQLHQLNDQIKSAVDSNGLETYCNYSDLEKRNLELASNFEKEKVQCEQLESIIVEYKNQIKYLERQLELLHVECESRIRNEVSPLEHEISTHRQTVGILVGEKTELSATLSHTQLLLQQKISECEELQARLKTSRSRVADLEREVNNLKEERNKYMQVHTGHNYELEKLQEELKELHINKAESEQDVSEMHERLKKIQDDNAILVSTCNELESKLDLASIKIQQLSSGGDPTTYEHFIDEKAMLEKQILDLNSSLKITLADRDQASSQYQQYVQQLNGNISSLAEKLEASSLENEIHLKREKDLINHINELEKRLQTVQQESANNIYKQSFPIDVLKQSDSDTEALKEKFQKLQSQNTDFQLKFETIKSERDEFIKDVENKKQTIEDLELMIEQLKSNQTNTSQMLVEIESEKVAASRAVDQNIKLKKELEEMQEAFIRMTNDKADLLTQLSSEQFRYKELDDLQIQTNHQLKTLTEAIEIKDKELTEMRMHAENVNKKVLHQDQLQDRLRHYEAHENSAHALTHELQLAKEEIQLLSQKNKELEMKLEASKETPTMKNVTQVELDNGNKLTPDYKNQYVQTQKTTEIIPATPHVNIEMTTNRETAMRQLETKFMRTMQEIANLQDEKQMLEHIVMQLQGETETIGEYIALYQHQRGVLKQRAIEKEVQLKQLEKDRKHMNMQLQMLNELVRRLLLENKVSDELLQQQQDINESASALCEEHAKIHQKMQETDVKREFDLTNTNQSHETAQQIIALLGEIKTNNLVQPNDISDNFHPCPLCSGQLITV